MPTEVRERTVEDFLAEVKNKQRHCCELHIMRTLVTMLKAEKFTRIFAIIITEIPCKSTALQNPLLIF